MTQPIDVFERLMRQLHERAQSLPEKSYTTSLLRGGIPKMAGKIREEAEELIEAAESQGDEQVVYEACDVIYHLWVLLASRGIGMEAIRNELARREGTSGLVEKAMRSPTTTPASKPLEDNEAK